MHVNPEDKSLVQSLFPPREELGGCRRVDRQALDKLLRAAQDLLPRAIVSVPAGSVANVARNVAACGGETARVKLVSGIKNKNRRKTTGNEKPPAKLKLW